MRTRLLTALLAGLVVLAGVAVNSADQGDVAAEQIPVPVRPGQDATLTSVSVHLHEARTVGELAFREEVLPTSGVWVVVDLSYAAHTRGTSINAMMLVDDEGRRYERTERAGVSPPMADADLWQRLEVAFEVPADALGEMRLELFVESRWQMLPVRFGRADLMLDPDLLEPGPVEVRPAELLPAGER